MDTVVIGAGAIGLGIAWRAAQRGRGVVVLDRGEPGRGASYHAAGMLAPITEATYGEEALLALSLESARRYPAFRAELAAASGHDLGSAAPGTLFVALDRDQLEALRHLHAFQLESGLEARWLDASACREREPGLHPGVRAGVLTAEQEIDPRHLTAALRMAVLAAGGAIRTRIGVRRVLSDGGLSEGGEHATGVELDSGEQLILDGPGPGCVVLAAGCWSGAIAGVPASVRSAVRPVKGQILRLRPRPGDALPIAHVVRTEEVYLVPRPGPDGGTDSGPAGGELVVGATVEDRGFDEALTGGGVFELLRAAIEAVPAVRELELAEASAGLRPGSRDNAPLLGPVAGGPEGLVVATGHYRNGILLTPVTADGVGAVVAGDPVPEFLRPFLPDRFEAVRRPDVVKARVS